MFFPPRFLFWYLALVLTTLAVAGGAVPREVSLGILAGLVLYMLFAPMMNAAMLAVAAIPLYLALPISPSFDSMASWRIVVAILCARWFVFEFLSRYASPRSFFGIFRQNAYELWRRLLPLERAALVLFFVVVLSLFAAEFPTAGIKKILFLINGALLYLVIRNVASHEKARIALFSAAVLSGIAALVVGFLQYIIIIFVSLYDFWQFWAWTVIPSFYGNTLGEVLLKSNSWFSYYEAAPPTLRMFSVFPDSHSFGLFAVLATGLGLIGILSRPTRLVSALIWFFSTLAIYFSGSRGIWLIASCIAIFLIIALVSSLDTHPKRKHWLLFLMYAGVGSLLLLYLGDQIALFEAFGQCDRLPVACENLALFIFVPLGSIITLAFVAAASFFATRLTVRLWDDIKTRVFRAHFPLIVGSFLLFLAMLPLASAISSRAHGFGVGSQDLTLAFKRAKSIFDVTEASNKARLDIWVRSAEAMVRNPLLGVGFGNYPLVLKEDIGASRRGSSAHNLYLDVGAETGVGGLIALILFFASILAMCWIILKRAIERSDFPRFDQKFAAVYAVYTIWIIGYNFFDIVLINDKVLLLYLSLLGIMSAIYSDAARPAKT